VGVSGSRSRRSQQVGRRALPEPDISSLLIKIGSCLPLLEFFLDITSLRPKALELESQVHSQVKLSVCSPDS
jgi:hypothetical protein